MEIKIKKKIRVILIAFLILMIPGFFLLKWFYAVDIHDRVMENIIIKGQDDSLQIYNGIKQLDRAKSLTRSNYLIYFDQARLYCMIKDYKSALHSINEYILVKPKSKRLIYQKALILDISGHTDSAITLYKIVYRDIKKFKNKEDSAIRMTNFVYLIYGRNSAIKILDNLKAKYPNDDMISSMFNFYDKLTRKELVLNNINTITPPNTVYNP
jgi:tetratricopeptide (TPR) repeat protein